MNRTISFYHQHAGKLDEQYQSQPFEAVHHSWKPFWPEGGEPFKVLDIGSGNGRDAEWYASRGGEVYAVEPADAFRKIGEDRTRDLAVTWLSDTLPELKTVNQLSLRFDYIVLSAVWMHIAPGERERAFRKLANLLAPNGRLVITLRHGSFSDERSSHPVSAEEIESLARDRALQVRHKTGKHGDALGRKDVEWETLVLTLPDDGSGDLIKVRHIIVNDNKSATYKLALLRTLLRIADAHPGAAFDRSDGNIVLPLGLVALYWMRQYKRLLDFDAGEGRGVQQNSDSNRGLGFVQPDGWEQLRHLAPDDLTIGAFFQGEEAAALQKALKDSIDTIKAGPVRFIYQGDISNPMFQIEKARRKPESSFILDITFLKSFGAFILEESLWDCLRLYSSWIEPLVVNQWIGEMRRYELNRRRDIPLQTYFDRLVWIDGGHDTRDVRKRIDGLRASNQTVVSIWSGRALKDSYQVDHCLPFAYWPNNDRWNLLPATDKENNEKRDRVPSKQRLNEAQVRVLAFWDLAWGSDREKRRFFSEAALSLPNISTKEDSFEAVYEAVKLQVRGVKSRLLVREW